tara:strand:- start:2163 stop:3518 length:1356 start_codon:yes stop_codon:yes gene_type:complete
LNRRKFIKTTAVLSSASLLKPSFAFSGSLSKLKIGVIGTGLRGQWMINLFLDRPDVEISAICDIDDKMIAMTKEIFRKKGRPIPKIYNRDENDYLNLLSNEDLDGVNIATPWRWHYPMAISAMKNNVHVGVEVPAALTVSECWDLVDTSEKTGKLCMIMENVCYRRDIMAILNMVRLGMFGEIIHCQGGYQHDLRHVKFNDGSQPYGGGVEFGKKGFSEARWRTQHSVDKNADLYPTHGLGPVSPMMDINRGNRMLHVTSTASQARGLNKYIVEKGGKDHPNAQVNFKLGDVVTSVIKCANGQTIVLSHDTNSPRPYSLNFRVQGTQGIWMKDNKSIYIEGLSPENHRWESENKYLNEYDHPLWKRFSSSKDNLSQAGHGGMDFFIARAFIESIKGAKKPVIDVYDAVSMSVIVPLSESSIESGSKPIKIPDFTRGKWKKNKPIFGLDDNY